MMMNLEKSVWINFDEFKDEVFVISFKWFEGEYMRGIKAGICKNFIIWVIW